MNIWSIIIAAAIFILPSLLPGKKSAGKKVVPEDAVPNDDFPVGEDVAQFMGADDQVLYEEDDQVADSDVLGRPVFSYETQGSDDNGIVVEVAAPVVDNDLLRMSDTTDSMLVTPLDEGFDLRKAIVFQAIMQPVSA